MNNEKHSQSPAVKENQITEFVYWILVKMAIDVVLYRLNSYLFR